MSSRRTEKTSRIIRETVSDAIQSQLSDPRIRGLISVTRVETSADLMRARVYLSMLGLDAKGQELSIRGIRHAKGYIQGRLASRLTTRNCPTLSFFADDSLKQGFAVTKLIDEITAERQARELRAEQEQGVEPGEADYEG